ncbi:MAG: WD40/YVTN/BNR-like repeat-containing protein [Pyrinomonadaceae bacterium]
MKFNSTFQTYCSHASRLLFLFLLFAPIADAQWQKQTVDTKASLRGLAVVNEKIVWASGTGGTFLKTIDGGKTWTIGKVPDADRLDFRDVEAFDANTAYLLSIGGGENSRIYKTIDGGATWKLQFKNTNEKAFFDALAFWDSRNGIAMSDPVNGKYFLIGTKDGGATWKSLDTDKMPNAKQGEAAFAASGTCLITKGKTDVFLVSGGNGARAFRSNNRGLSWVVADTPIIKGTTGSGIFSIAMFDKMGGVIVGGNYEKPNEITDNLAFTNDGGKTWNLSKGLTGYRSGVTFINKNTLLAVGSSGSDLSTDGGKSWKKLDNENYNAVQAKGKKAIWAVGANGLLAKYSFK